MSAVSVFEKLNSEAYVQNRKPRTLLELNKFYHGKDVHEIAETALKNAASGDAIALYELSILYDHGVPCTNKKCPNKNAPVLNKNPRLAFENALAAAKKNLTEAQVTIGKIYQFGDEEAGVPKDKRKAFVYYSLAASKGDADAQCGAAYLLMKGKGVTKDFKKGFELMLKAAMQEHDEAMGMVAMYYLGAEREDCDLHGIAIDIEKARKLFAKAAEKHDPFAQYIIATWILLEGNHAPEANKSAFDLLNFAKDSEHGDIPDMAFYNLAICYLRGMGTTKNLQEAFSCLLASLKDDPIHSDHSPEAQFNLAIYYLYGLGVKKDIVKGQKYLEQALMADIVRGDNGKVGLHTKIKINPIKKEKSDQSFPPIILGSSDIKSVILDPNSGSHLALVAKDKSGHRSFIPLTSSDLSVDKNEFILDFIAPKYVYNGIHKQPQTVEATILNQYNASTTVAPVTAPTTTNTTTINNTSTSTSTNAYKF